MMISSTEPSSVNPYWVFGMVDTLATPCSIGYCSCSTRPFCTTLLPIIQQYVALGTIVWWDEWAAYNTVSSVPNVAQHDTVNHSIEFVNPTTGVHIQNVESYWNRQKTKLKRMRVVVFSEISGYLDEFMWRERWGKTSRAVFNNILCAHTAQQYPD